MCSLQESLYFSILADESLDISTKVELSFCGTWLVNGKPENHFLTVLYVCSTDAGTIGEALQSFLQQKQLDLRKLTSQGYQGTVTFAGEVSGLHKQADLFFSCNLHPLFLSQVTVHFNSGSCISEGDQDVFGTITSVWKCFIIQPKKQRHCRASRLFLVFLS